MKIKQLELKGFKSFRNSTRVRFEQGVSCIVGPNGCGKSNLVDAFLWVMGETAPKHLRSKAMEDVIFAGAGNVPPASRAEVSLIMQSSPDSYSKSKEIMVTRRLNRDGVSEYLLNSCPARLKDVQEIFMDTGIGVHGFSFIEQGAIESFISSRPEQKKQMVESVAGISRFRFRKKEAEKKLSLTEKNLNRLQDILERQEIELKKLKKQSETAQKFKQLKDQVRKTERELKIFDLQNIQIKQNQINEEIKNKNQDQKRIKNKQADFLVLFQQLNNQRKKTRQKQEALRNQKADLENQLLSLEKQLSGKKAALEIKKQNLRSISQTTDGEKNLNHTCPVTRRQNLNSALKQNEQQVIEEQQKQKTLKNTWLSFKQKEQELFDLDSSFQIEKEKLLKQLSELEYDKILSDQKIHLGQEKLKETSQHLQQIQTKLIQKQQENKNLLSKESDLKVKREKSQQMSFDMGDLIENQKSHLVAVQADIQEAEQKIKNLRKQENVSYSEWQSLKKRKALMEEEQRAKTFVLNQITFSDDNSLGKSPFCDTVKAIQFSSDFLEKAVSSFLSHRLKSVFVLDQKQAIQALKQIQEKKLSSCRFILPLKDSASLNLEQKAKIQQTLGFQFFLHDKAQGIQELIDALFSHVVVVDHLTTALKMKAQYPTWSFMTLEGEAISEQGDLISYGHGEEDNILSWEKALDKALRTYEHTKSLRLQSEQELTKKQELYQKLSNKMTTLNHEERSFEIKTLSIKKDLESLNREKKINLQDKNQLIDQQEEIKNKQKNIETEQKILAQKQKAFEIKIPELQKAQTDLQEKQKNHNTVKHQYLLKKEDLWQKLLSCETQLARLKEQKTMLLKQKEQLQHEQEQDTLKIQEQKSLILVEQKALAQTEESKKLLDQKIKEKSDQIDQLITQEKKLENQKENVDLDLQDSRKQQIQEQADLSELKLKKQSLDLKKQSVLENTQLEDIKGWEDAPVLDNFDRQKAEQTLNQLNRSLSRMGALNFLALQEYEQLNQENQFYQKQYEDLITSRKKLFEVIKRIDSFCSKKFKQVFEEVRERFSRLWPILFEGGKADLILSVDQQGEQGLEIKVQPPGKQIQNMNLLSGGEKAMTAVAMMFALFLVKPSPFCILDEVDAPLDDNNVTRFKALLSEMARLSQVILITHNKVSMKEADVLYGVTMEEKGISKIMSLKPTKKFVGSQSALL